MRLSKLQTYRHTFFSFIGLSRRGLTITIFEGTLDLKVLTFNKTLTKEKCCKARRAENF